MVHCIHTLHMFHFLKVHDPREALWVVAVERDFPDAARRFAPLDPLAVPTLPAGYQVGVMGAGPFDRSDWRKTLAVSGNLTPEERRVLDREADAVVEAELGPPPHHGIGHLPVGGAP